MPVLSYDLHVHPGPSKTPRWGTGDEVLRAAEAAGVHGFVWKAHEQHTPRLCAALPPSPVRAFGSASLNPWSTRDDVLEALDDGARVALGADDLGGGRDRLGARAAAVLGRARGRALAHRAARRILATGHLGAPGRAQFAQLAAASPYLLCSVTHTLYVPPAELLELAAQGAAFEIDAYTLRHDLPGRIRHRPEETIDALRGGGRARLLHLRRRPGRAPATRSPSARSPSTSWER